MQGVSLHRLMNSHSWVPKESKLKKLELCLALNAGTIVLQRIQRDTKWNNQRHGLKQMHVAVTLRITHSALEGSEFSTAVSAARPCDFMGSKNVILSKYFGITAFHRPRYAYIHGLFSNKTYRA